MLQCCRIISVARSHPECQMLWTYTITCFLTSYMLSLFMNVVIDTSIWISALIGKEGASREIIRQALRQNVSPQMSMTLFLEYEAVMKRKKIQSRCPLTVKEQQELFQAFLSVCTWNEIFYLWRPNLDDENDNFLIELAVASNSKVIITNNIKDIAYGELHFEIEVQTPGTFLERYRL